MGLLTTVEDLSTYLLEGYWARVGEGWRAFDTDASNRIEVNLTGLNADGKRLATQALMAWEMVADLRFVQVPFGGDIFFDDNVGFNAYSTMTVSGNTIVSSEVYVGTAWLDRFGTTLDSYSFQTYIHEIGHALGLGHPGPYNGTASQNPQDVLTGDSWQLSIMSYYAQDENGVTGVDFAGPITPMMADIAAIQSLYGAATSSPTLDTSGSTTWGANTTLGGYLSGFAAFLDGVRDPQNWSGLRSVAYTIFDEGGTDTLDLSFSDIGVHLDLNPGTASDVGGLRGNLLIALGTTLENALTGGGNDRVLGNSANNTITGGLGGDHLSGDAGNDRLFGNRGNDTLLGGLGNDRLNGGYGSDRLYGGVGADVLIGHDGNDTLYGQAGRDTLDGGAGADTIYGNVGDDRLLGGIGRDTLDGGRGNDRLYGGGDEDLLNGNIGADLLSGGGGADRLLGSDGNDRLLGNTGNDRLFGGDGNDRLNGGLGDDTLEGGAGNDVLFGGAGADRFIFYADFGTDRVVDFTAGEDVLALDDAIWGGGLTIEDIIAAHTVVEGQNTVFDFGPDAALTLVGFTDPLVSAVDLLII